MEKVIYTIDLDSLSNDDYGVKNIAFTKTPAIKMVGLAMSDEVKRLIFEDEKKLQVCAPLLIPMEVYRYDKEEGEYYVQFTAEVVEKVTKQMMKNLSLNGQSTIFTNEHTDTPIDAYIFELMLVDNENKQDFIKGNYGYDMPLGGVWLTVQCDNKGTYDYLVEDKKLGLSIDGFFKLKQIQMAENKKKIRLSARKLKFKKVGKSLKFETIVSDDDDTLIVDEIKKGEEVTEVTDSGTIEKAEDGVYLIPEEEVLITIEAGEITEVEENVDNIEAETEEEKKEEEVEAEEETPTTVIESLTKSDLSEALEPLLEAITELKGLTNPVEDKEEVVELSEQKKGLNIGLMLARSK